MNDNDRDIETKDDGLEAARPALSRAFEPMPADVQAAVRRRLLSAIAAPRLPLGVRVARALVAVAAGVSLLGGVAYAAASSMPGDILYPVKRAAESALSAVHLTVEPAHDAPAPGTGSSVAPQGIPVAPSTTRGTESPGVGGPPSTRQSRPATVGPGRGKDATCALPPGQSKPKRSRTNRGNGGRGSNGAGKTSSRKASGTRAARGGSHSTSYSGRGDPGSRI